MCELWHPGLFWSWGIMSRKFAARAFVYSITLCIQVIYLFNQNLYFALSWCIGSSTHNLIYVISIIKYTAPVKSSKYKMYHHRYIFFSLDIANWLVAELTYDHPEIRQVRPSAHSYPNYLDLSSGKETINIISPSQSFLRCIQKL